jgi:SAM-dependent methyltransferase
MRSRDNALRFGEAAGAYELGRPEYPDAAIDWMIAHLNTSPRLPDIVDVGAGTGKLTRALERRAGEIFAVEPDASMRESLTGNVPRAHVFAGSAESIPLEDDSADLVTFGQAWHWVDPPAASAEVARILRPGGRLGLIWNQRDTRVDFVSRLGRIIESESEDYDTVHPPIAEPLEELDHAEFEWQHPMDEARLIAMVASRSYVIARSPNDREELLERVRELVATHPDLVGRSEFQMPYVTFATIAG